MNSQAIQKKLNNYMETATPEQVVKEFEDLGVEFVNTNDMNLIQQLQVTPKWKEFKEWYNTQGYSILLEREGNIGAVFIEMLFEFQKGVFEKFIESQDYHLCTERRKNGKGLVLVPVLYKIPGLNDNWTQCLVNDNCDSFEELLIRYFNN